MGGGKTCYLTPPGDHSHNSAAASPQRPPPAPPTRTRGTRRGGGDTLLPHTSWGLLTYLSSGLTSPPASGSSLTTVAPAACTHRLPWAMMSCLLVFALSSVLPGPFLSGLNS